MRPRSLVAILIVICAGLWGIVTLRSADHSQAITDRPQLASVIIRDVPHETQRPDFCGEACTAMWLHKLGKHGNQNSVFALSGVDPQEGRGAYSGELAQALVHLGFRIGRGAYPVVGGRPDTKEQLEQQFQQMHADLLRGVPSIVCMHYDDKPNTTEHFRLILGYDAAADQVIFHEPAEVDGAYRQMGRERFLDLWPLKTGVVFKLRS